MKIAVLGSGGWGTALAMLLAENGHTVTLWSYLEEESRRLQQTRENPLLPGVTLPESLSYTWDLSCVRGCGVVVMATRRTENFSIWSLTLAFFRMPAVSMKRNLPTSFSK